MKHFSAISVALFFCLSSHYQIKCQGATVEYRNFTTLSQAIEDAEKHILTINGTVNLPSLVFGLSVKGRVIMNKAFGLADLSNNLPAKPSTKYAIGSITKTFTSAIIGNLVAQGRLTYDDPISFHLPETVFPVKRWKGQPVNLTLRHLLSHTGGVHVSELPKDLLNARAVENSTQTMASFKDEPLHFAPGSTFSYSNFGFKILGAVIESVTKRRYQDVAAEFLAKNRLYSSFIGNNSVILEDIPRYYTAPEPGRHPKVNLPTTPYDELVFLEGNWPDGGIISTTGDLLKYGQRLIDAYHGRGEDIVPQAVLKEMWTSQVAPPQGVASFIQSEYCLGWGKAVNNSKLRYPHFYWHTGKVYRLSLPLLLISTLPITTGALIGATSMLAVYPDEEMVATVLTNKGSFSEMDKLILHITENVYPMITNA